MRFERVSEERFEEVLEHLRSAFFADEPLNKAQQLVRGPGEGHAELEAQCLYTLKDNLSVMALSEDNRLMGVALNGILKRGDVERALEALEHSKDERFVRIFRFLYKDGNLSTFDKLPVDRLFEIRILSVDSGFRGQGVAKSLLEECERVAKANGFRAMKADATGFFSQKICSSLGMETLREIRYDEYKDEATGLPVFAVDPPHESLKVMYKWLN